jgi:hypothetical protein
MKKISIDQIVDPTSLQPFTANSLKFLQDYLDEDKAAFIKAMITANKGTYSLTVPYVISGCAVSDSNKDVTAGEIFYGGKFYETPAVNGTTNTARFILTKTQDATADPLEFTDNVSKNVHDIYRYVPTDVASGGDFLSTDLVSAYGSNSVTTSTTNNGQTITTTTTSGGPLAYNTDSYVYSYYIVGGILYLNFEIVFTVTTGGIFSAFHLPLPNGITKLTSLTAAQSLKGSASLMAPGGTTNYLTLQSYSNFGGAEGQRITVRRIAEGDTDMTISSVATTIRGEIRIMV